MSVICSHQELGHNFLEFFLATYSFARFFFTKIPHGGELAFSTRYLTAPFKNSKNFQIFGCACPRIELIRRCQPSRKFVVLGLLPRVLSYTDQIDGGNGGSLQVRRKEAIHQYPYQHWNIVQYMSVQSTAQSLQPLEAEIKVVNILISKAKFGKDKCEHNLFNKFHFPK